jgi:CheY-like chemotaxis protein
MQPDAAQDGASALILLEDAAATDRPYALALLDLYMPGMDGLELAEHISRRQSLAGIELLLLTSVPDVTAEEARAHGIRERLTKPVQLSRLHAAIQAATQRSSVPHRVWSPPAIHPRGSRGHILIVEDNHINQLVAVAILEALGFSTEVAGNGREALASYGSQPFDAVLMDCQMPEMDGYAATQRIRRIEGPGSRTPVIAMTAGVGAGERERCLVAGMDDYLTKPVNTNELNAALSRWVPATVV